MKRRNNKSLSTRVHKRIKIFLKDNNVEYEYVDVDLSSREDRETIRKEILKMEGKLTYPGDYYRRQSIDQRFSQG